MTHGAPVVSPGHLPDFHQALRTPDSGGRFWPAAVGALTVSLFSQLPEALPGYLAFKVGKLVLDWFSWHGWSVALTET